MSDVDITPTPRIRRTQIVSWGAMVAVAALMITGMFIWAGAQNAARSGRE